MAIYNRYIIYECKKCHVYYKSDHDGKCPKCGRELFAIESIGTYYYGALD